MVSQVLGAAAAIATGVVAAAVKGRGASEQLMAQGGDTRNRIIQSFKAGLQALARSLQTVPTEQKKAQEIQLRKAEGLPGEKIAAPVVKLPPKPGWFADPKVSAAYDIANEAASIEYTLRTANLDASQLAEAGKQIKILSRFITIEKSNEKMKSYCELFGEIREALIQRVHEDLKEKLTRIEAVTRGDLTPDTVQLIKDGFECIRQIQEAPEFEGSSKKRSLKHFHADIEKLKRQLQDRLFDYVFDYENLQRARAVQGYTQSAVDTVSGWIPDGIKNKARQFAANHSTVAQGLSTAGAWVGAAAKTVAKADYYATSRLVRGAARFVADNFPKETDTVVDAMDTVGGYAEKPLSLAKKGWKWVQEKAFPQIEKAKPYITNAKQAASRTFHSAVQDRHQLISKTGKGLLAISGTILTGAARNYTNTGSVEADNELCYPYEPSTVSVCASLALPVAGYMAYHEKINAKVAQCIAGASDRIQQVSQGFQRGKEYAKNQFSRAKAAAVQAAPKAAMVVGSLGGVYALSDSSLSTFLVTAGTASLLTAGIMHQCFKARYAPKPPAGGGNPDAQPEAAAAGQGVGIEEPVVGNAPVGEPPIEGAAPH